MVLMQQVSCDALENPLVATMRRAFDGDYDRMIER